MFNGQKLRKKINKIIKLNKQWTAKIVKLNYIKINGNVICVKTGKLFNFLKQRAILKKILDKANTSKK